MSLIFLRLSMISVVSMISIMSHREEQCWVLYVIMDLFLGMMIWI